MIKLGLLLLLFTLLFNVSESLATDCRERISQIVCLVDPLDESNSFTTAYNRPCLDGGEKFSKIFEKHFDQSHSVIKKMYCSLEKIWIENELSTTAYASPIFDQSDNLVGAGIGIKKEFLLEAPGLSSWLSQKDNSSYGNTSAVTINTKKNTHSAIHFALNHEFGHIFDYANKINRYDGPCNAVVFPQDCRPASGSWTHLSWKNAKESNETNNHPLFKRLCFYQCGGEYLANDSAVIIYEELMKTNFASTYSTLNAKEDWAEAFALYLETSGKDLEISATTPLKTFDLSKHFNSHRLKEKRLFIEKFLDSEIIYPGQSL